MNTAATLGRASRWSLVIVVTLLGMIPLACNTRQPLPEAPATGPTTVPQTPIAPVSTLFAVNVAPGAVYAGESATGSVLLTAAAPPGGLPVTFTVSDPSVSVPTTIIVPSGQDSATFPVTTQSFSADRDVVVTGTGGGRTASRTLQLWTVLPVFFSFVSEPMIRLGEAPRPGSRRRIPSSRRGVARAR